MGLVKETSKKSDFLIDREGLAQEFIPLYYLQRRPLTIFEALISYLKDEKKLNYRTISFMINRDERNVRDVYIKSKKKHLEKVKKTSDILIPISIFANRNLSPLEVLVSYLKEVYSLSYHEIALLLKRNDRTIWTVCQRAKKKNIQQEK